MNRCLLVRFALAACVIATVGSNASAQAPGKGPHGPPPAHRPHFGDLDTNGDGFITAGELAAASAARDAAMLKRLDTDGDGAISKAEFHAGRPAAGPGGPPGKSVPHGPPPGRRPHFADLDTNGDGFITADELAAASAARQAEMIKRLDTDGDGAISKAEFDAGRPARGPGGPPGHHRGPPPKKDQ